MAIGYEVNKAILDTKIADAVLAMRAALNKIEAVAKWLANHPNGETDPLVTQYGYTADEAYAIRIYFESVDSIRTTNANISDIGRKMTGLE